MHFKELAVAGYGNIKKASIDLDYQGITFIFGKNKDAGPDSTNGAGKSQFWTAIPEIAYGTPPTGKDGHKHTSAEISLTLQNGDNEYKFTENFSKKGGKAYTVHKNGKNINIRGVDYTQKKLQQFLGQTEEDFYTKVYIDSQKVHPLINGSAAQRQEFFVRAFNLENVDRMRRLLQAELNEVRKVSATYKEVRALFESARSELKTTEEERKELDAEIEELRALRDRLLKRSTELQDVRDLVAFERDNKELITRFLKVSSPDSYHADLKTLKVKKASLKNKLREALEWKVYHKEAAKYRKAVDEAEGKLKEILPGEESWSRKELKARSEEYEDADGVARRLRRDLERTDVPDRPELQDQPSVDAEKARRQCERLEEELEHVHEFKDGKCPTCGSSVKARPVEDVKSELKKWKSRLADAKAFERYEELLKDYKSKKAKRKELEDQVDRAELKAKKLRKYAKAFAVWKDVPSKPEAPEGKALDSEELEAELEKVQRRLHLFDSVEAIVDRIDSLKTLTPKKREAVKEFDSLSDKLSKINTKLTHKETFRTQQAEAVAQLEKLKTRGKTLKKQASEEPVLKALVEAYSDKGMKRLMIQRRAALLERQVNKFVKFTFSEDFTFEFKYDKRLEVLAHRRYGKSVKTTDVKRLSGAEKKMFTLLLVVARYTMTPKNQRSNLLILDELEANMGPPAVEAFLKALPVLNKIIPHIVVITPRPELGIEGARCFTAVKQRGITTLVEGRK